MQKGDLSRSPFLRSLRARAGERKGEGVGLVFTNEVYSVLRMLWIAPEVVREGLSMWAIGIDIGDCL